MPLRVAILAGGFATATALAAAIAGSALPSPVAAAQNTQASAPQAAVRVRTVVLPPGVTPPPGALATILPAPQQAPQQVVVRTTQSGKIIP